MIVPAEVAMEAPEDHWVARCRAGDVDAFGWIYARHEQQVYRYAYRMLSHREDAHDVRQETFMRAYQAIASFRGDCSLQTWLLKICANVCRNMLRSRNLREEISYDSPSTQAHLDARAGGGLAMADPAWIVEQAQTRQILRAALRGLPVAQRELIVLREYEGLSCEEIGEILGCAAATVRVKLFRARRRLKERVESLTKTR